MLKNGLVKNGKGVVNDSVLRSAMASKLAYAQSVQTVRMFPAYKQLLIDTQKFNVIDCKKTGAHAYIWKTGERSHLVSFRGSHNFVDICKYIFNGQEKFAFCDNHTKIHGLIKEMFSSIENDLSKIIFEDGYSKKRNITFCGHSLGGALAMFSSVYYSNLTNSRHNITCHTFGAPKMGDEYFMTWFNQYVKEYVNCCNKSDIVTYYPFSNEYKDNNAIYLKDTTYNILKDHDLDTYIDNIRNDIHAQCYPK